MDSQGWIRTSDHAGNSRGLYYLSYLARFHQSGIPSWCSCLLSPSTSEIVHSNGIGVTGFAPAASWSRTTRSTIELHPGETEGGGVAPQPAGPAVFETAVDTRPLHLPEDPDAGGRTLLTPS